MDERWKLRKKILTLRDNQAESIRKKKSKLIREKILALEEISKASCVMVYVNFRSEVETLPLIRELQARGIIVAAPLTLTEQHRLLPYQIEDPDCDLIPGYCSIPEPDPKRLVKIDPAKLDLILVPGSVFDPTGGRLGYGGGYYDRFLSLEAPQALSVGLAFELQVVAEIPLQDHDVPLERLITEKRIIIKN